MCIYMYIHMYVYTSVCAYMYTYTDTERQRFPSTWPNLVCISITILRFLLAFDRVNISLILETLSPPVCWTSILWILAMLLSLLCSSSFWLLNVGRLQDPVLSLDYPKIYCIQTYNFQWHLYTYGPKMYISTSTFPLKLPVYISSHLLDITCWHPSGISNLTYLKHHSQ